MTHTTMTYPLQINIFFSRDSTHFRLHFICALTLIQAENIKNFSLPRSYLVIQISIHTYFQLRAVMVERGESYEKSRKSDDIYSEASALPERIPLFKRTNDDVADCISVARHRQSHRHERERQQQQEKEE